QVVSLNEGRRDGWGASYGKHENSGVDLQELTEARRPLIMATERSVKYHQVTRPSSFSSSCYPSKSFTYSTFRKAFP
ncbi:MAG TPA: hypothetical protein VF074_01305, partial [Pyrinomonadaceae bacterium]